MFTPAFPAVGLPSNSRCPPVGLLFGTLVVGLIMGTTLILTAFNGVNGATVLLLWNSQTNVTPNDATGSLMRFMRFMLHRTLIT